MAWYSPARSSLSKATRSSRVTFRAPLASKCLLTMLISCSAACINATKILKSSDDSRLFDSCGDLSSRLDCFFLHHRCISFHFVWVYRQANVDLVASRVGVATRQRKPAPIKSEPNHTQQQYQQHHDHQ